MIPVYFLLVKSVGGHYEKNLIITSLIFTH
jgi:hypothetical protein